MPAVKKYTRINFQNYPSTSTPLNATNLNKMDKGIDDLDDEVVTVKNAIENMSFDADSISYDNTSSGLQATDVQDAVDEINDNLTASNQTAGVTNVPFRFGCTDDGKFGYIINQGGADTVIPFNSEYKYMIVGLSGISFAFCIDTENGIAAVKTDSDADTINNEYLKIKSSGYNVTVTANKNIVIHYIGGYTDNSNANFEDFTEKSMSTNETLTISQTSGHDKFYILVEK